MAELMTEAWVVHLVALTEIQSLDPHPKKSPALRPTSPESPPVPQSAPALQRPTPKLLSAPVLQPPMPAPRSCAAQCLMSAPRSTQPVAPPCPLVSGPKGFSTRDAPCLWPVVHPAEKIAPLRPLAPGLAMRWTLPSSQELPSVRPPGCLPETLLMSVRPPGRQPELLTCACALEIQSARPLVLQQLHSARLPEAQFQPVQPSGRPSENPPARPPEIQPARCPGLPPELWSRSAHPPGPPPMTRPKSAWCPSRPSVVCLLSSQPHGRPPAS
ncbi:proline-rich extensin-like protein EPR1 [Melanotaenia boesemani]|uniref:proline-rich extensin-like protein EPR1 n=1 Tax=Melanotaenia boesemani TaxID=1250792 RepID=UPI001C0472A4|nr:proline-rich extensin-like protein EPR1 [Melanotaenia boesemani]